MIRHRFRHAMIVALAGLVMLTACATSVGPSPSNQPDGDVRPTANLAPSGGELSSAPASMPAAAALDSDPLHGVELYDVNGQSAFTLGQLASDGPVLLEMMAIWCTNCRAQQQQVVAAHALETFHSVSLDIDPNERPGDLADYSAAMGFEWRFALANQSLAAALRERFGAAVLNPPSTPMILLFPDGSLRALEFRGYSAQELAAEIAAG